MRCIRAGPGLFNVALTNPKFAAQKGLSYFALENDDWIILGLDSAYFSKNNLYQDGDLGVFQTGVAPAMSQKAFMMAMRDRALNASPQKRIIVMTHHHALDENGGWVEDYWDQAEDVLLDPLAYWYWAHIHVAIVFSPYRGKIRFRCVGHGGIPYEPLSGGVSPASPVTRLWTESETRYDPEISATRGLNGFAVLRLNGPDLIEEFYDENGDGKWSSTGTPPAPLSGPAVLSSTPGPTSSPGRNPNWTDTSTDSNGYSYVENSDSWKKTCEALPCFKALQWPDYDTTIVEDTINGQPVVIQLWKGNCEQFLGRQDSPGGIGAEVGIYRRIPGKVLVSAPDFVPAPLRLLYNKIAGGVNDEFWWPWPELNTELTFTLTNTATSEVLFEAGAERTYWLCKWMEPSSYDQYKKTHSTPAFAANYRLTFTVNGKTYPAWD